MSHHAFTPPTYLGYSTGTRTSYTWTDGPEPTIEEAGIRAGEIIGWRCWQIDHSGLLKSVVVSECIWFPGETVTMNQVHDLGLINGGPIKKLPIVAGEGVHAFKHIDWVRQEYGHRSVYGALIYGTVALWGEVIEHERGYRAEFGRVHSIHSVRDHSRDRPDEVKRLRKLYNVEDVTHG